MHKDIKELIDMLPEEKGLVFATRDILYKLAEIGELRKKSETLSLFGLFLSGFCFAVGLFAMLGGHVFLGILNLAWVAFSLSTFISNKE